MVRHAKAFDRALWQQMHQKPDIERPLTDEGVKSFTKVAKWLSTFVQPVHLIVCSPSVRTKQTSEILHQFYPQVNVQVDDVFLQQTPIEQTVQKIQEHLTQSQVLVVVGHENHFSNLLSYLLGIHGSNHVRFKKGGCALLDVKIENEKIFSKLVWMITPKLIASMKAKKV